MRALVLASVLAAIALAPTAAAGCLATVHGLCIRDPGNDPCDSVMACDACLATVDACVHLRACLAGDWRACVEHDSYCLYMQDYCGPPQ